MQALESLKVPEISARMGLCGGTVRHWLKRFNAHGLRDAFGIGLLFQPQGTFQENELIVRLDKVFTNVEVLKLPLGQ
jgi:hypothetical protein